MKLTAHVGPDQIIIGNLLVICVFQGKQIHAMICTAYRSRQKRPGSLARRKIENGTLENDNVNARTGTATMQTLVLLRAH